MSELDEKKEEERRAVREVIMRRLDAGFRQWLLGCLYSMGDELASDTEESAIFLFLLWQYIGTYGATDQGKTGLADSNLFNQAKELYLDLKRLLKIKKDMHKFDGSDEEWDLYVRKPLLRLEEKYSKKTGITIREDPELLEDTICGVIIDLAPQMFAQTGTVLSMDTRMREFFFTPENIPRFRRPDLDGLRRER